jgi:hypothetical protein
MGLCGNPLSRSLSGVKRTCPFALHMSAYDPKRTSARPPQETNPSLYDGCSVLGSCWLPRPVCYSTGASNCAHHFGRARAGTFAEQLILHDCVSHANRPLLLTVASGAAAALAAGDDNEGGPEGAAISRQVAGRAPCEQQNKQRRYLSHDLYLATFWMRPSELLKARADVGAAIGSDLSVDASLVSATYGAILKCLGAIRT